MESVAHCSVHDVESRAGGQSSREESLFLADMRKEIAKFTSLDGPMTEKMDALNHIGYIAYIGADETTPLQKTLVPSLADLVEDESCTQLLKSQAIITLTSMAHGNPAIQKALCSDRRLLGELFRIVGDTENGHLSRLSCNLLLYAVNDNRHAMAKVRDVPEAEANLIKAADVPLPWMPWRENLADTLLKLLGFRSPRQ